jgi:hypothetical protein
MKRRAFAVSSGVILALTALAKAWTVAAGGKILLVAEPLSGLPFKHVFPLVAAVELAIAVVCLFTKAHRLATMLVAWMATNFLVYRVGLWWMGWRKPCGCLGNLTDALHISPQTADHLIKLLLAYLLVGSYGLLIWQWRQRRKTAPKMEDGGLRMAD